MKNNKLQKLFLKILFLFTLSLMPFLLRKPPIKDWILVYCFNAVSNGFIDHILVKKGIVKYPVRLLPKLFNIHILFDFLIYPTIDIIYNQMTYKDKFVSIFYKLLLLTIPMLVIEIWAEKKTNLIKWQKGWRGYHTFIAITVKSLFTRFLIGLVRYVDAKQEG